jgi:hypothetical protein
MFTITSNFLHHWIPIHIVETLPNLVMNFMSTSVNPLGAPRGPPFYAQIQCIYIEEENQQQRFKEADPILLKVIESKKKALRARNLGTLVPPHDNIS